MGGDEQGNDGHPPRPVRRAALAWWGLGAAAGLVAAGAWVSLRPSRAPDAPPSRAAEAAPAAAAAAAYTCPMHPAFVTGDAKARCPECGMKLVPRSADLADGKAPERGPGGLGPVETQPGAGPAHGRADGGGGARAARRDDPRAGVRRRGRQPARRGERALLRVDRGDWRGQRRAAGREGQRPRAPLQPGRRRGAAAAPRRDALVGFRRRPGRDRLRPPITSGRPAPSSSCSGSPRRTWTSSWRAARRTGR